MSDLMNDVMGGMYNEVTKSNNLKISEIFLDDIKLNDSNHYSIEMIDELAENIKENGLNTPLTIYKDDKGYTLLSGHRRYKAYEKLVKDGVYDINDLKVNCFIVSKPKTKEDELMTIISYNLHREKTSSDRLKEVEVLSKVYDLTNQKGKKRDWIGMQLVISGRQVQKYLTALNEDKKEDEAKNHSKGLKDINKFLKKAKKDFKQIDKFDFSNANRETINELKETKDMIDQLIKEIKERI